MFFKKRKNSRTLPPSPPPPPAPLPPPPKIHKKSCLHIDTNFFALFAEDDYLRINLHTGKIEKGAKFNDICVH